MAQVQTVTDRLRGNLSNLESEARLGEQERQSALLRRAALDQEALQMMDGFLAREQQLVRFKLSLAESEARNAAESRELSAMFHECRSFMPPSPMLRSPAVTPSHPGAVSREEHERILRAALAPHRKYH